MVENQKSGRKKLEKSKVINTFLMYIGMNEMANNMEQK